MSRSGIRIRLDDWFPTVVRYTGLALVIFASLDWQHRGALFAPAVGLILFKTAVKARDAILGNGKDEEK